MNGSVGWLTTLRLYHDIHIATETGQQSHYSLNRQVPKLPSEHPRNIGLAYAHYAARLHLSQLAILEDILDSSYKLGFK